MVIDIPEIDYVVHSNRYGDYISDKFDYIIANHVMEHAPNMIQWLSDLCDMLQPGGILFLALPDKKFSFDKYRQDTALSHFVAEYLAGVEEIPREHQIECEIYYDEAFVNRPMQVSDKLDMNRIREKLKAPPHVGIHSHVFESGTIVSKVLKPILMMGFMEFNLADFVPARGETGGEMIIVLRKEPPRVELTTEEFYTAPMDTTNMSNTVDAAGRLAEAEKALAELRARLAVLQEEIASRTSTIRALESSTSWRITAPLRAAVTKLRALGAGGRNISY
ncbi:class I SAM-dependent methyltransferase [Paraburkholderia xenovorans]|uniref:class I SAM-dependent methyltransferase n=1 Tax=Paraburkholderia xenovorans TaxID=36873 RepID=UPI0020A6654F|nr:methyltransferase domain-containing protein [Paraburkholderia xenovorans]